MTQPSKTVTIAVNGTVAWAGTNNAEAGSRQNVARGSLGARGKNG